MRSPLALSIIGVAVGVAARHDSHPDPGEFDFRGTGSSNIPDVAMQDRGPWDISARRWAEIMASPTWEGTYPVPNAYNVSSPDRDPMDGWTVTYAIQNWIDAGILGHRFTQDAIENATFAGASVRLNPPQSLYDNALERPFRFNNSWDNYTYDGDNVGSDPIGHKNWRVCATRIRFWGIAGGYFDEAGEKGGCGGAVSAACVKEIHELQMKTNAFDDCGAGDEAYDSGETWEHGMTERIKQNVILPSCWSDVEPRIYNTTDVFPPPRLAAGALRLSYQNWTYESDDDFRQGGRAEADGIDWLHGSELWSASGVVSDTAYRYEQSQEEAGDRALFRLKEQAHAVLLTWVHKPGWISSNETNEESTVSWSLICHGDYNETETGKNQAKQLADEFNGQGEDDDNGDDGGSGAAHASGVTSITLLALFSSLYAWSL